MAIIWKQLSGGGRVGIKWDGAALEEWAKREMSRRIRLALEVVKTHLIEKSSRANVTGEKAEPFSYPHKDSGEFVRSLKVVMDESSLTGHLVSDSPHAQALEEGTRPHVIVPVRAKALAWTDPATGQKIVRSMVLHPGHAPLAPFTKAFAECADQIKRILEAYASF